MFEEYQICPYTGLRSFTEEESLYFKGREEHIEHATEQLQRNKFLMLTGASGDGKSSLVYAGIVPNARAGFLKSKYSQWAVAEFRPERSPFRNLCRALAKQLGISGVQTVEAELQHGFSALVDLYKNSPCYVDTSSVEWQQANETEKAALKRSAANLMIIVDQFEEFFTNPENYHRGVPSRDSNLVLNVLLETARIALEEDLPIYIVFTMRSDYIGQCAAFRSLPEYIGFSQFFVPRLNRSQLQQVIEEPASLSGNRISRRLAERLILDISEGVDQLPILQHALNQIWHAAANGKEEMDLIHYAMVGGMSPDELPDEQSDRFAAWYARQPEKIKQFYSDPNLQNVLDTHANKLYESAAESYRNKTGKAITDAAAKDIIKTTFVCLTKIDQSRAVRNRMTLKEIYHILNRKDVDIETVGWVLNIFREPGNTFIRPFITEDPESGKLNEQAVLDITHESLIRNWEYLEQWAKEEFDNYSISLDFKKQLDRWVHSNRSSGFLLSIGPLTYFENWYNGVNPNAWWIARYLRQDLKQSKKLEKAEVILRNSQDFLKESARKHAVTRTIMRYGPRRIAAVLAIIGLITLSSFALRNYLHQQNAFVLSLIKEQTYQLAGSSKVDFYQKSILLAEQLKAGQTTIPEIINHVSDSMMRINVVNRLAGMLILQGRSEPKNEIWESLQVADSLLNQYPLEISDAEKLTSLVTEVNYLRAVFELGCMYMPTNEMKSLRKRNAERSAKLALHILKTRPDGFKDINKLNVAIENAISHEGFSSEELEELLTLLSPFENPNREAWIVKNYAKDNVAIRGYFDYGFKFNGLYQELAYLYAAQGKTDRIMQCIDSLLKHNQSYYQNDYTAVIDNVTNVAGVLYAYRHEALFDSFVKAYCQRKKMTELDFYQRLIGRNHVGEGAPANLNEFIPAPTNLNVEYGSEEMMSFFFEQYRISIEQNVSEQNGRSFYLALSWKDEAVLRLTRRKLGNLNIREPAITGMFGKAIEHYRKADKDFINQQISISRFTDNDATQMPRKYLFLYPDYRTAFNPREPRNYYFYFNSEFFIQYILDHNLFNEVYPEADLPHISSWFEAYFANMADAAFQVRKRADTTVLIKLDESLAQKNTSLRHSNYLYLLLGNEAYKAGNTSMANQYYGKIEIDKIANLFNYSEGDAKRESLYAIASCITGLLGMDSLADAYTIIKVFKSPINRSSLYAFAAKELLKESGNTPIVQQLLDSSRIELTRIENLSTGQPNRILIAYALAMQDPHAHTPEAYKIIKNIGNKYWPGLRISRAFAFHGDLFGAHQNINENVSDGDQTEFLWNILYGYAEGQDSVQPEWREFTDNYFWQSTRIILYVDENN